MASLFDSDRGKLARCRQGGLKRAAYWRELGWPNLKLARAQYALNAAARRAAKELAQRRKDEGLDMDDPVGWARSASANRGAG